MVVSATDTIFYGSIARRQTGGLVDDAVFRDLLFDILDVHHQDPAL